MPITKSGQDEAPTWCELSYFEVVPLAAGETREFARRGKREKIIVGAGQCRIQRGGQAVEGEYKTNVDLEGDGDYFEVTAGDGPTTLVWMCGDWEDETASGIFTVDKATGARTKATRSTTPRKPASIATTTTATSTGFSSRAVGSR